MMTKNIYVSLFLVVMSFPTVFSQTKIDNTSTATPFLNITPDARSAGMGNVGTAVSSGAFAFYHNAAAGLFTNEKAELAYSYTPWMRDVVSGSSLHSVGGYYKIGTKQSVVVGFRSFTHADVAISDEEGNITTRFTPKDWAIDFGYSRCLAKNLAMSLTFRYISSDMGTFNGADIANAVAFDLGVYYRRNLSLLNERASWALGLQLANIGSKIKYLETSYDLPRKAKLGGSLNLPFTDKHALQCAIDMGYMFASSDASAIDASVGVEYTFLKYGILRGGYYLGDNSKGNDSYATLGCGANFYHLRADFSYLMASSTSVLKNTFRFSLGIDLDLFKSNK